MNMPTSQVPQGTVVDGANIATGREVDEDNSRYSSAGRSKNSFTPTHVFQVHTYWNQAGLLSETSFYTV